MGRRVIAVIAAAVLALIGAAAVFVYARGADQRAIAEAQPRTIFVSEKPVVAGTSLADAVRQRALVETQVAAKGFPIGGLAVVDESNQNLVAITDIGVGEYVLASRFGTTPTGRKAIQVPAGQVAVSVSLTDPARVGTFVTPGSKIVIYETYEAKRVTVTATQGSAGSATATAATDSGKATRVLLPDVLVIAMGDISLTPVGNQPDQPQQGRGASFLVTVALPPAEANRLVHGIQTGTLYAGLRGADVVLDPALVITDANVFEAK